MLTALQKAWNSSSSVPYEVRWAAQFLNVAWQARVVSHGKRPLLVFQMGRVGSHAVVESVGRQVANRWPVHVHRLSLNGIVDDERMFRSRYSERNQIFRDLSRAQYLRRNLPRWCASQPIEIITMTRDPGQRALSDFMQWLDWDHPDLAHRLRAAADPLALRHELLEAFERDHLTASRPGYRRVGPPFGWFDEELLSVFGIDVFAQEFDKSSGYSILENDVARVLLLRFEDMPMVIGRAMADFLAVRDFVLHRVNRTQDKKNQAAAYRTLLGDAFLDETTLHEMYDSEKVRHFYSQDEVLQFRAPWVQNA